MSSCFYGLSGFSDISVKMNSKVREDYGTKKHMALILDLGKLKLKS